MTTVRLDELHRMTHPALCARYRALGYIGGLHPLEKWLKEELISSILDLEARRAKAGCNQCRQPGESCGFAFVADEYVPCVCCAEPTMIRAVCGAARNAVCPGAAPVAAPAAAPARKPAAPRAARTGRARSRTKEQQDATAAAIAALDTGQPVRLLDALENGPFAPLRLIEDGDRRSLPFWQPPLPGITFATSIVTGYSWERPYAGSATVLDRSGAWVAAASSVQIAHGALEHTGPLAEFGGRPGYYQVAVYPWYESAVMPSPLGHVKHETAWIPAPTAALLRELVNQGRWPDVAVLDSYTGDPCRLSDWTTHVNALRAHAISTYGRQSPRYNDVKEAFGMAMSLMLGVVDDGVRRTWKCKARRPDITHHVQAQAAATLWRWGDDCRQVTPDLPPVALRNIDELVVPTDAVDVLTRTPRPGGRKPLELDELGVKLGTFKIKGTEQWEVG
jgi:hypothetical protein